MKQLTMGDVEFSYKLPLTSERVFKVNRVGVYPMKRVNQIHNKSIKTTPNNSKIFNISFPNILIRVINHRVYRTKLHTLPIATST